MWNYELGMGAKSSLALRHSAFCIHHSELICNIIVLGIVIFYTFAPTIDFFAKSKYLIIS